MWRKQLKLILNPNFLPIEDLTLVEKALAERYWKSTIGYHEKESASEDSHSEKLWVRNLAMKKLTHEVQ